MTKAELWDKFQTACWNCGVINSVYSLTVEETHDVFCRDCTIAEGTNKKEFKGA